MSRLPARWHRGTAPRMSTPITLPPAAPLSVYQRYIQQLEAMHGWDKVDLVHNCFLMGEEVGELFKAVRKYNRYFDEGGSRPTDEAKEHVGEEIVDVLNYLLAIANRVGVEPGGTPVRGRGVALDLVEHRQAPQETWHDVFC